MYLRGRKLENKNAFKKSSKDCYKKYEQIRESEITKLKKIKDDEKYITQILQDKFIQK